MLQRTGMELGRIIDDLELLLAEGSPNIPNTALATVPVSTIRPTDPTAYTIRFDGSLIKGVGAGIGITLAYKFSGGLIAEFSIPARTYDAQRTEMLGPVFAALIVSCF
jgi:hypothetical protein